jgi:hypothetical protein
MEIMVSTMMEKNAMARARATSVIAFPPPGSVMKYLHYRAAEPSGRPSKEVMEGRERIFCETKRDDMKGEIQDTPLWGCSFATCH